MHVTPTLLDPIDQQIGFCPSPASKAAASLPAPAAAQGAGNRNQSAWLSIADFLARQNLRQVLAQRAAAGAAAAKRSAAAAPAAAGLSGLSALPDGNHGEYL